MYAEANAGKKGGLATFYSAYLADTSAAHEAAVAGAAAKSSERAASVDLGVEEPKSDAQIVAESGKRVELNADGQIVDRRELLGGGLNVVKRRTFGPRRPAGFSVKISERESATESKSSTSTHPSGLTAEQRGRMSRERHSREAERQLLELEERKRKQEEEAQESTVKKIKRRNDDSKVEELRRAALERRRMRAQAEAAAEPAST
jgi:coiled-coil domain-containing protein 55